MTASERERRDAARLALALTEVCVRNTGLEDLHAGQEPASRTGDFSDVTVMTPDGEIPGAEVSRISDAEMKTLMIEIVDRLYTCLLHPETMDDLRSGTGGWDAPKLDANLMNRVRRLQSGRAVGDDDLGQPPA